MLSFVTLSWLAEPAAALDAPPLKGRINDYAGMLSQTTAQSLERKLAAFEQETTNQVVLLTVPSLDGDTIEGFAIRVAEARRLDRRTKAMVSC